MRPSSNLGRRVLWGSIVLFGFWLLSTSEFTLVPRDPDAPSDSELYQQFQRVRTVCGGQAASPEIHLGKAQAVGFMQTFSTQQDVPAKINACRLALIAEGWSHATTDSKRPQQGTALKFCNARFSAVMVIRPRAPGASYSLTLVWTPDTRDKDYCDAPKSQ